MEYGRSVQTGTEEYPIPDDDRIRERLKDDTETVPEIPDSDIGG